MLPDVGKHVLGGLIIAAVLGLTGYLARGVLVEVLGGARQERVEALETEITKLTKTLETVSGTINSSAQTTDIITRELESLKHYTEESYETINQNMSHLGQKYALAGTGRILIQSDNETPSSEPSKWLKMADDGLQTSIEVHFAEPYSIPPNVIVGVDSFSYSRSAKPQYIRVRPLNVLEDRFFMVLEVGAGSNVSDLHTHWLAYGR